MGSGRAARWLGTSGERLSTIDEPFFPIIPSDFGQNRCFGPLWVHVACSKGSPRASWWCGLCSQHPYASAGPILSLRTHDGRQRWSVENEAFWRGLGGSQNFRFLELAPFGSGGVLYIAPSKNIQKFSQSDHGNINLESIPREIAPGDFHREADSATRSRHQHFRRSNRPVLTQNRWFPSR